MLSRSSAESTNEAVKETEEENSTATTFAATRRTLTAVLTVVCQSTLTSSPKQDNYLPFKAIFAVRSFFRSRSSGSSNPVRSPASSSLFACRLPLEPSIAPKYPPFCLPFSVPFDRSPSASLVLLLPRCLLFHALLRLSHAGGVADEPSASDAGIRGELCGERTCRWYPGAKECAIVLGSSPDRI